MIEKQQQCNQQELKVDVGGKEIDGEALNVVVAQITERMRGEETREQPYMKNACERGTKSSRSRDESALPDRSLWKDDKATRTLEHEQLLKQRKARERGGLEGGQCVVLEVESRQLTLHGECSCIDAGDEVVVEAQDRELRERVDGVAGHIRYAVE